MSWARAGAAGASTASAKARQEATSATLPIAAG